MLYIHEYKYVPHLIKVRCWTICVYWILCIQSPLISGFHNNNPSENQAPTFKDPDQSLHFLKTPKMFTYCISTSCSL